MSVGTYALCSSTTSFSDKNLSSRRPCRNSRSRSTSVRSWSAQQNQWLTRHVQRFIRHCYPLGDSVAEWIAYRTQEQKCPGSNRSLTLLGNSLRQTVHTHRASVHQAAKLVAALLRVVGVTAGLVESNGSLPPGLWLTSPAGWLPRTGISSGTVRSVIEYGLPLPFLLLLIDVSQHASLHTGLQCRSLMQCYRHKHF